MIPVLFTLALSACRVGPEESGSETGSDLTENTQSVSNVVQTNQLGADYYRPALTEGSTYQTSANRGITLNLNSGINISLFEKDLMRLSQSMFATDDYFIQEGQYLPADLIYTWVGRESEDNPEGLNPASAGTGDDRVPNYLNSILELDFYRQTDSGLELAGMSIALAMNTVDYYRDEERRPLSQDIPEDQILARGQEMANEIVRRIRTEEDLGEMPIYVGIYEQSAADSLAGGTYVAEGESLNGATDVNEWTEINEKRLVFPLQGGDSAEGNAFANFRSEVESFFPNLSGVTGRAHYIEDQMKSLSISVVTQFYGEAEIIAFTQYLKQSAEAYLPADLEVEIIVQSPHQMLAFLEKSETETEYFSYVFD